MEVISNMLPNTSLRGALATKQSHNVRRLLRRHIPCLFAMTCHVLLLFGCSSSNIPTGGNHKFEAPLFTVETYKVMAAPFLFEIKSVGTLESPQSIEITSEASGKIVFLNIPEGEFVTSGRLLARINDSTNIAEIKTVQAQLVNAQENYNRMKALKDEGAISQQTLDNSFEKLETLTAELERVKSLQVKTEIIAPFSGFLSLKKVSLGSYIDSGDPLVRISQINPINLVFSIPEKYSTSLKAGQLVKFYVEQNKKQYLGKVIAIDPYVDESTRTVKLKAEVQNQKYELLPGSFVDISLSVREIDNAILIPQQSIFQDGPVRKIYKIIDDDKVSLQEVTVGEFFEDSVRVLSGVIDGNTVVVSGYQKLKPGMKVVAKPFEKIHNQNLDIGATANNNYSGN